MEICGWKQRIARSSVGAKGKTDLLLPHSILDVVRGMWFRFLCFLLLIMLIYALGSRSMSLMLDYVDFLKCLRWVNLPTRNLGFSFGDFDFQSMNAFLNDVVYVNGVTLHDLSRFL